MLAALPAGEPERIALGPDDLAYVAFTSGSTGLPKGILGRHGPLSHFLPWQCERFGMTEADRFSMLSGLSHDPLQRDLFTPLYLGASIRVPDPDEVAPARLAAWMAREGVTVAHLTPAMGQVLTEGTEGLEVASLRRVLLVGDALTRLDVARLRRLAPAVTVVNLYGSTETQRAVACHLVAEEEIAAGERGRQVLPLGRGMEDVQLLVLTRENRQAGVGELGEICVRSPHLAAGYLGDEELTREKFVLNPITGRPGDRIYRTGDLGRYLPDGEVELVSRADHQVKIRGFRIELGEIEAHLGRQPGVSEAVVVARDTPGVGRRLVAYVVGEAATEALREALKSRLPAYMVPAAFVKLAALPITPNGKVDRKALPEPEGETAAEGFVAPRTPTEEILAGIWCDVLGLERVGVHQDFFDLGGHSLIATRVVSRVWSVLRREIPVRILFTHPTITGLARVLDAAEESAAAPTLEALGDDAARPLSFAQQRLWFLDRLEPGGSAYNLFKALRLTGRLDVSALEWAAGEVLRRHQALRTVFSLRDGEPVQAVTPAGFSLPLIDLSALPAGIPEGEARRLAVGEAARPFDLARDRMLRAALLRLESSRHLALLTMHHIASDGWSMGILVREVTALYAARLEGRPSLLPELPVQYGDFAVWQRRWLSGEVLNREISWWRERLAGAPPVLELPLDRPRPALRRSRGAVETGVLPDLAELATFSRREGATLFMTLLTAVQALLARLTGQEDVVTGSPVANRNRVEIEPLIGFFVNTLVLRTGLEGDPSFREALGRVRDATLSAWAHQDMPFERLVEELSPERSLSHTPLFQVMIVLQNAPGERLSLPGLEVEGLEDEATTAKFDLQLSFAETPRGLVAGLVYDTDLFLPATAKRLLGHLETLLTAAPGEPERRLGDLPLLSEAERRQLVLEWNEAPAEDLGTGTLHERFTLQAARFPDAVAVVCDGADLTYGDLDRRANQIAHHLIGLGVIPGGLVGLRLERSLEMVAAILGVLKAGAAYVPLDPTYPAERLAFMVEDSGVSIVLTEESLTAIEGSASDPRVRVYAEYPAYVIYTSGSTGRPKGVIVRHGNVARLFSATDRWFRFGPEDIWTLFHSYAFDFSVWEIWGALLYGGRLVVVPYWVSRSPEAFHELLSKERVTVLNQTPSAFRQLIQTAEGQPLELALRYVIFGGEALEPASLVPWFERHGDERPRLINMYGITETTVHVTYREISAKDVASAVGCPIPDLGVYLLDAWLSPAPVGNPGEIFVGGAGLALGYLNRPELTAERFVPNPFGEPGSRLYRSGDLARRLPDGDLEYLGRVDHQVKIRGFRIELGEIEATLARHHGVQEVVVRERRDRLVAWVVPAAGEAPTLPGLRAFVGDHLPDYMLPSALLVVEGLPLTPNGKVDHKALPEPEASPAAAGAEPATPLEKRLAEIWSEVLGVERVGAGQDFFELGGHSLLAVRLLSKVDDVLGVRLPIRDLFQAPTLREMAARIAAEIPEEGAPVAEEPLVKELVVEEPWVEKPPEEEAPAERQDALRRVRSLSADDLLDLVNRLPKRAVEAPAHSRRIPPALRDGGPLPLSFSQERLWFLDRLEGGGPAYNIPAAVRLTGALDTGALWAAVRSVVDRHESLRTRFVESGGRPSQVVEPSLDVRMPVVDLASLPARAGESEVLRLAAADARWIFDLAAGPLARFTLLRLSGGDHVLLVNLHHIVSDGWSMGVLIREMAAFYEAARAGLPASLRPLPVQYPDFAVWQRERLGGGVLESHLAWWRERLEGAPAVLDLPMDRHRQAARSQRGDRIATPVPAAVAAGLQAVGRRAGATPFMTLLAAFQALLARYTGGDAPVGSPIAGRNRGELEGLIGFFVNILVLRTGMAGDPTFAGLVERVREVTLGAYSHQDVPFEKLVEELAPRRDLSHSPLFQVMLSLQNLPLPALEVPGLRLDPLPVSAGVAKFDLSLTLADAADGGFDGSLEYDLDLFDPATAERIAGHFQTLLAGAAANPGLRLSDLPLLTAAETAQIAAWGRGAESAPEARCVHELIEAWADRDPEAVAVVAGGESLTFGELEARANRLARRLREAGVGPEVRVALSVPRSPQGVVAILAILKAGGVYLPLDPSYPRERRAWMLEDSGARVVVTTEPLRDELPVPDGVAVLLLDGLEAGDASRPAGWALPESLAYVIYTSGSTGRPKGVGVDHGTAARHLRDFGPALDIAPGVRLLQTAAWSFDISIDQILATLAAGGSVAIWEGELDPANLRGQVAALGVNFIDLVPAFLQLWTQQNAGSEEPDLDVRAVLAGGDTLPPEVARLWPATPLRNARLFNGYGPTETVVTSTLQRVPAGASLPSVPIGGPLAGRSAYVLDENGRPVPAGVPGELLLGGVLARGYLGRPDATAEKFVPDPFAADPGRRLYRTGDKVRWLAAGNLEFLGRVDQQVKVRGFRIEPGEIEAALTAHPAVAQAAVVVVGEEDRRLVAFTVARDGEMPETDELRIFLGRTLPAHMVPAAFATLPALPLTPAGKVDRRALAGMASSTESRAYVAPSTPVEETLAGIWASVLRLDRVGVRDDFFELGGHSLLAVQVISRIDDELGVRLPIRDLFEAPILREMAARIAAEMPEEGKPAAAEPPVAEPPVKEPAAQDALRRVKSLSVDVLRNLAGRLPRRKTETPAQPRIQSAPRDGDLPLSFAQERLWFLDQLQPGSPAYNIPSALRIAGPLDVPALWAALREVVRRHEALRTAFAVRAGRPVQVIFPEVEPPMPVVDLTGLEPERREAELRAVAAEEGMRPFDLRRAPMIRVALARLADGEHALFQTLHHIASDGWSAGVMIHETVTLYRAFSQGQPSPLPELPVQYADFAVWQRELAPGGGPGGAARLVAGPAGRRARAPTRHRPAAVGGPETPWGRPSHGPDARGERGRAGARPAVERHAVHGPARRFRGATGPLHGPGRPDPRHHHRQPHPPRGGGPDRLFHQQPGAARRPLGRSSVRSHGGPGARIGPGGLRPSGRAVREAGGRAAAGAGPLALAPVPGPLPAPERAHGAGGAAGGRRDHPGGGGRRDGEVRPRGQPLAGGSGLPRRAAVRLRSLRGGHGGADGPALRDPGRGGRGGPVPVALGAAAAVRRGDPPTGDRNAAGAPRRRGPARAVRGPGGPRSRSCGGGLRRREADLRRSRPPGQPGRESPRRTGRRPRRSGGPADGALAGDGGGDPGRAQGRRGLRAARSGVSGGAAGLHDRGQRGSGRPDLSGGHRRRNLRSSRPGLGGSSGVRDLHLGLDGPAQGRDRAPWQRRASVLGHGPLARLRR